MDFSQISQMQRCVVVIFILFLAVSLIQGCFHWLSSPIHSGVMADQSLPMLQLLRWCCVECVIHHERDVREEQHHTYVARTSNNRVIMAYELYCCLLPRCEALRIGYSGFPIATKWCCDQDVKVVRSSAFTQRTCDRCGSL